MADLIATEEPTLSPELSGPPRDREALRQKHKGDEAAGNWSALMTLACLVLGVIGWALETWSTLPRPIVVALYMGSYLAGGLGSTRHALGALINKGKLTVDLLMVLAALGAAVLGAWPEGAALLFLFALSHALEHHILGRTRRAIGALMDLTPEEAVVLRDGGEVRVPLADLSVGDRILVRPGERIAADGLILVGRSGVDQSAMTGESVPVERGVGDPVFAATLNGQGALEVEVTRLAGDTALARIVRLVEEAQGAKAPSQNLTEWFGASYTLVVLLLALATMAVPPLVFAEPFSRSFYRAMTVLVVASPCAVVISIPAAILSAIAGAARRGILFKGGAFLERASGLRAVAFDKTGTLTMGKPRLVDLRPADGVDPDALLALAASAEAPSEHPLSRAVVTLAQERGLTLSPATDVEAIVGRGLQARVEGRLVRVGKADLLEEAGVAIPPALAESAAILASEGNTVVFVGEDQAVLGVLAIADGLRPTAEPAVQALRELGINYIVMLTGDNERVAAAIAGSLAIEHASGLLPEDKLKLIQDLLGRFGSVAMVGDGINDAPALAAASLGVSVGVGGTDVALETADVVLMRDDLTLLPEAIALARRADRVIRQNLVFAFGMMALLLATTYLGRLPLPLAVLGHEGSTVLVILNGVRLLRAPR